MTDEKQPRKTPITGRSARDRARARESSAAKAKAAATKRDTAMETRVNIAIGAKAMSLAPMFPMVRRVLASAAAEHRGTSLGMMLKGSAAGADPLDGRLDYEEAWNAWQRIRRLNAAIEDAWVALEPTLASSDPDELSDEHCRLIERTAEEWESLIGAEHPAMRLLRLTSR